MNISAMQLEIRRFSDAMVCKPSLPYFFLASELRTKVVLIAAFDQLHCPLQSNLRRDQQMYVLGHNHERV